MLWQEAGRRNLTPALPQPAQGYQYTTPDGLLGMLRSNEVWLSDYAYLNDSTEIFHGIEQAREIFCQVARDRPESRAMLRAQSVPDLFGHRTYVSSFSSQRDSLSQWRAYGPIAVGFEFGMMSFGYGNAVRVAPVIYDREAQLAILRLLAHLNASAWEGENKSEQRRLRSLYYDNTARLLDLVAFFKNPGFADEREIRMVYSDNEATWKNFGLERPVDRFRSSGDAVVPYIATSDAYENRPERLPLTEVVIGPIPNADTLRQGVERALKAHGYDVPVRHSGVTFRG